MAIKHSTPLKKLQTTSPKTIKSLQSIKKLRDNMIAVRNNYLGKNNNNNNSSSFQENSNKSFTSPISQKSLPQQIIIRNLQKQVLLRKQLYLILHACHCKKNNSVKKEDKDQENEESFCTLDGCAYAKKQIEHLVKCQNSSTCGFENCASFKKTALHYKQCHKEKCSLCGPAIAKYNRDDIKNTKK